MADADSALRKKMMVIQGDETLTSQEKGQAMQALMSSKWDAGNNATNGNLSLYERCFPISIRNNITFKFKLLPWPRA